MRVRHGAVRAITPAGPRAVVLEIEATDPSPVRWSAGQFVSVQITADGERRSFSIISPAATDSVFELLVGAGPGGGTRAFVDGLEPGSPIAYFGPMGYFTAPAGHTGELICGVTGVGISAVLPMLSGRGGALFWSVRERGDAALLERVERMPGVELELRVTGEGQPRIVAALVRAATSAVDPLVVLCGSPSMIGDAIAGLRAAGFATHSRVITEMFHPPAAPLQL